MSFGQVLSFLLGAFNVIRFLIAGLFGRFNSRSVHVASFSRFLLKHLARSVQTVPQGTVILVATGRVQCLLDRSFWLLLCAFSVNRFLIAGLFRLFYARAVQITYFSRFLFKHMARSV